VGQRGLTPKPRPLSWHDFCLGALTAVDGCLRKRRVFISASLATTLLCPNQSIGSMKRNDTSLYACMSNSLRAPPSCSLSKDFAIRQVSLAFSYNSLDLVSWLLSFHRGKNEASSIPKSLAFLCGLSSMRTVRTSVR
jgi:hypothetical protein